MPCPYRLLLLLQFTGPILKRKAGDSLPLPA